MQNSQGLGLHCILLGDTAEPIAGAQEPRPLLGAPAACRQNGSGEGVENADEKRGEIWVMLCNSTHRLAGVEGKRAIKRTLDNATGKMVVPFAERGKLKEESSLEDASIAVFGTHST